MSNSHSEGNAGGGQRKQGKTSSWGRRALRWDDIIIVFFALLGTIGSVVLYRTASAPPIIISFFLAMGVSSLVYRFLGGIEGAEFAWGTLHVGGTLAALAGIAVGVNQYLQVQSLAMVSLDGRYEWQYAAAGWKGHIDVDKDGAASIYMDRYMNCGGSLQPVALLRQSGPGKMAWKQGQTEVHVEIPVRFVHYDANCRETRTDETTVLAGDLARTPAFAGTIEYRSRYGMPLGGMMLIKDSASTLW